MVSKLIRAKMAPNDLAYLNVGCGRCFSPDWNNLDLIPIHGVIAHDIRHALPYPDCTFEATYSSHVLEHLTPVQGEFFLREQYRVLKPGGICRIAVPDLEKIVRDYLGRLEDVVAEPSRSHVLDYEWTVLQLVDQQVREETGGETLKALRSGRYNAAFVRSRCGDEFDGFIAEGTEISRPEACSASFKSKLRSFKQRMRQAFHIEPPPRQHGEVHRWMYDRVSLRLLVERLGFAGFAVVTHDQSRIPDWDKYRLDTSTKGPIPRKPDSIFAEAVKPA